MKKLVFASNNQNKLKEVRSLLPQAFQLLSLNDIKCTDEIEEIEKTLQGNAILKANYITNNYNYDCFADDTGLEVEVLDGEPGVYSARYAGANCNSEQNIEKLLFNLKGENNRNARFRTVIALNLNGKQYLFEGICKGTILEQKRGNDGFGYDAIFQPDGYAISFAQMSMEEKGKISHRGKAVAKLIAFLGVI